MRRYSLIAIVFLVSCGVQQKLSESYKLSPGMEKEDVKAILGAPIKSDFYKGVEEWHYCKTGMDADEFLALFFENGKLIEKRNYTVTIRDTGGAYGSCEKFIKMGNYIEPESVSEIRLKY